MENRMTYAEKENRLNRINSALYRILKVEETDTKKYAEYKNFYDRLMEELIKEHMMTRIGLR